MPIDIVLGDVSADRPKHENYTEYVEDLRERLEKSHQIARKHLGVAADRRKQEYDLKVIPRSLSFSRIMNVRKCVCANIRRCNES